MKNKKGIVFYGIKDFPSRGGTSRVVENIILNIKDKYPVTLCCLKDRNAKSNIPGIRVHEFSLISKSGLGVFIYYLFSAFYILFFVKRNNIVHAHKTDCAFFVPLLRLKFKVIITSHEAPYKRDKWKFIGKMYFKLMERIFIFSGALLTSISEPLASYYKERYKKEVYFIPNGININQNYNDSEAEKILKSANITSPYISFAARRLMETKGCHTMLEALDKLKYPNSILIAGELDHAGDYIQTLKKKYSHLDLHFIGYIEPLPVLLSLIRRSELFIFPSETEGMSIMFLEVIAAETNIIASDIPENLQVLNHDEVLYFKNKDAVDLAKKIEYALGNKQQMELYTQKSIQKVKSSFTWDRISLRYIELYNAL